MKPARYVGFALILILLVGIAVPYIDAEGYRERIQNALERALNRKVTARKVRFNLLTGPGFTVEGVTIEDDPRIGIEPLAYVESLNARVRLTTLWTRSLSFSNLRLDNPAVNLAKADNGLWNFQLLLRDASARAAASHQFPSIQVRTGRINFKFGDYKTIFYLSDSDLDVNPLSVDRLDVRFSGQPARTDQAAQNFGRLLGHGVWKRMPDGAGELDANVELERSGISDLVRLVEGHPIGVHGVVASRAHISGPVDKLRFAGQLRLDDVHRWDMIPPKSGGWDLKYQGTADLIAQKIDLQTDREQEPGIPFLLRFRASDYLSDPKFAAMLEVKEAPVSGFLEVARHMGAALPDGFSADGKVSGLIGYSRPGGVQGQFAVRESSMRLQQAPPLDIRTAEFVIDGNSVHIGPATVALADGQTADVQGAYDAETGAANVEIATRGMKIADLRTGSGRLLGVGAIPLLEACTEGSWRGWVKYIREGANAAWSGAFELHGARLNLDGLSEPVRIVSATVEVSGPKIVVTQLKARAGTIHFSGEYRRDREGRPDRARFDIPEADAAELEKLFLPTLQRDAGFLARFRLKPIPAPDWLRSRRLDAAVRIQELSVADQTWSLGKLRLLWDGTAIRLTGMEARQGEAQASGELAVDLAAGAPLYRFEGKMENIEYRGGTLNMEGSGDTRGTGSSLLANAAATGAFTGDDLTLSPELDLRSISGNFELTGGGRLRLMGIQAEQGAEAYSGQGLTQPDGRILLELTSGKRQVRVAVAR
jgi:hypothetical protein